MELMKQAFQYNAALVSYAFCLCRDYAAAEDVVHEAYLVLMEKWASYDPTYSVYSWVRKMVYFKTLEHLRARDRHVLSGDEELLDLVRSALDMEVNEESVHRFGLRMKCLDRCVEELGEASQAMLVSYYWNRESCDEIAARLRRSVNAVWLSLSRIRKSLKECVERYLRNPSEDIVPGTNGGAA